MCALGLCDTQLHTQPERSPDNQALCEAQHILGTSTPLIHSTYCIEQTHSISEL